MTFLNRALRFIVSVQIALSPATIFGSQEARSSQQTSEPLVHSHLPPLPETINGFDYLLGAQLEQSFDIEVGDQTLTYEAAVTTFLTTKSEEVRSQIAWGELNTQGELPVFDIGIQGEPSPADKLDLSPDIRRRIVRIEVPRSLYLKAKSFYENRIRGLETPQGASVPNALEFLKAHYQMGKEWVRSTPQYQATAQGFHLLKTEYVPTGDETVTGLIRFGAVGAAIGSAYFFAGAHFGAALTTTIVLAAISGSLNAYGRAYADFTVYRGWTYRQTLPAFKFIADAFGLQPDDVRQIGVKKNGRAITMEEALENSILVNLPNNVIKYAVVEVPILMIMRLIFAAFGVPLEESIIDAAVAIGLTTLGMIGGQGTFDVGLSVARDIQKRKIEERVEAEILSREQADKLLKRNNRFYVYTLAAVGIIINFAAAGVAMTDVTVRQASATLMQGLSWIGLAYIGTITVMYDGLFHGIVRKIGRETGCSGRLQSLKNRFSALMNRARPSNNN